MINWVYSTYLWQLFKIAMNSFSIEFEIPHTLFYELCSQHWIRCVYKGMSRFVQYRIQRQVSLLLLQKMAKLTFLLMFVSALCIFQGKHWIMWLIYFRIQKRWLRYVILYYFIFCHNLFLNMNCNNTQRVKQYYKTERRLEMIWLGRMEINVSHSHKAQISHPYSLLVDILNLSNSTHNKGGRDIWESRKNWQNDREFNISIIPIFAQEFNITHNSKRVAMDAFWNFDAKIGQISSQSSILSIP